MKGSRERLLDVYVMDNLLGLSSFGRQVISKSSFTLSSSIDGGQGVGEKVGSVFAEHAN